MNECRGHQSTVGPIGNVIFCNGTCRPKKTIQQFTIALFTWDTDGNGKQEIRLNRHTVDGTLKDAQDVCQQLTAARGDVMSGWEVIGNQELSQ